MCWSLFLNKNAGLQYRNFIKKRLQHRCFPINIAKFLRRLVLKNICERLFKRFATSANNITSNRKWRRHFLSARWKKLAFTWCSWSFRFFLFLHCMYQVAFALIIKDDSSEGLLKQLNQWGANPGPMEKLS